MRSILLVTILLLARADLAKGADVSNMDLKNITLGSTYNEAKRMHSCLNGSTATIGNKSWVWGAHCEKSNETISLNLDHNETVWRVRTRRAFSIEPNWLRVKEQLLDKYGTPDIEARKAPSRRNRSRGEGYIQSFCWGDCRVTNEDGEYWRGGVARGKVNGKYLQIEYSSFSDDYSLALNISDLLISNKDDLWKKNAHENEERRLRSGESELDL